MSAIEKQILQSPGGYRYSVDPFLLAAFVDLPDRARVLDLGSGSGVMLFLLHQCAPDAELVGLEIQAEMVTRARDTLVMNELEGRIEFLQGDVRSLPGELVLGSFDVVVSNPPYRKVDAGRVSKGTERSHARHELTGVLKDFLTAASVLLKTKGSFSIVYIVERLPELLSEMRSCRLEPKRLRMVHSRAGDDAKLVLVEGRKGGRSGLKVEPPLVIYKGAGRDYSEEILSMYNKVGVRVSELETG